MSAAGVAVLGVVLLVLGFVLKIAILWTIGIVALVVALILLLLVGVPHRRDRL